MYTDGLKTILEKNFDISKH